MSKLIGLPEAGMKIHGRIDRAAELLSALHQNAVRLQRVVAQRQLPSVPLDQAEWHVDHRKFASRSLQLAGPHELHLDFGGQFVG
jgi:hypothetical protein